MSYRDRFWPRSPELLRLAVSLSSRRPGILAFLDKLAVGYTSLMTKEDFFEQAVNAFGDDKLDEAIDLYGKAIALDGNYQDALHGLGMAFFNRGRLDDAVATAKRLIEIDNDDILAHTSLSMFYQAQGRIEEAEKEGNVARILGWKQELRGSGS